jgi:ornithine cyclodeaminase/alanine dehydrogenase-like protein (mu-crystallin family)
MSNVLSEEKKQQVIALGKLGWPLGRKPGRLSDAEITVYKAMGVAMEDMVAANPAYQKAKREGRGAVMAW